MPAPLTGAALNPRSGSRRAARYSKFEHLKHVEEIPDYEHMDLIWARDAPQKVFSKIAKLLEAYE